MPKDNANAHSEEDKCGPSGEPPPPGGLPNDYQPADIHREPDPPNWVEKWTFVALVLTFGAAMLASVEAWRLADLTQDALRDARVAAQSSHNDNINNENLTADAIGHAQDVANVAHADNVAALTAIQKTATAAQRSNSNFIAAQRAHFFSNAMTISKQGDTDPSPVINYSLFNAGGAATVILSQVECFVGAGVPKKVTYAAKRPRTAMSSIGTNATFATETTCTPDTKVTPQDYIDIAAKKKSFLIWGYITFRDNFGEIFTQRFGMFGAESGKFYAMPIPAYNIEIKGYQK